MLLEAMKTTMSLPLFSFPEHQMLQSILHYKASTSDGISNFASFEKTKKN